MLHSTMATKRAAAAYSPRDSDELGGTSTHAGPASVAVELTSLEPTEPSDEIADLPRESNKSDIADTVALVGESEPGALPHEEGTSSIPQAAFNFVNTIIGSGIIGLPYAMNEAGLWLGLIELVLFAILTDYSVNILVQSGVQMGITDYQLIMRHSFGKVRFPA